MLIIDTAERFRQLLANNPALKTQNMNQQCKVCNEPAAGFHFGAFTCEGCKSFFGRTYNNLGSISECKNNGECVINKKNRTSCKACRLRKCLLVGMSKSGSRYGRRSNWFKIHCLLQEQSASYPYPKEEKHSHHHHHDHDDELEKKPSKSPLTNIWFQPYPRPVAPMFLEPWPREKVLASPSPGVLALEQDAPIDLSVKRHQTQDTGVLDLTKRESSFARPSAQQSPDAPSTSAELTLTFYKNPPKTLCSPAFFER